MPTSKPGLDIYSIIMAREERMRIPSKTTIRELANFPTRAPIKIQIYEYDEKKKSKQNKSTEYLSMELKALSKDLKRKSSLESIESGPSDFKQTMERLNSLDKTHTSGEPNQSKVDVSAVTHCKFQDISLVSAELAMEMSGLKSFFHYFKSNTKEHISAMTERLEEVERRCETFGLFQLSTRLERSLSFFKRDAAKLDTITSDTFRLRRRNQLDECIKLFLAIGNIADVIY